MYSEMSTTFVFIRRLKINGTLEVRHVFPLNTPDLMDEQLEYLFKTSFKTSRNLFNIFSFIG